MLLVSISIPSDPETPPSAHSVDTIHGALVWNTKLSRQKDTPPRRRVVQFKKTWPTGQTNPLAYQQHNLQERRQF